MSLIYCCVDCAVAMRPRKNDIRVVETLDDGVTPYRIWCADLWECPRCNHQLIAGFGIKPIAEKRDKDFAEELAEIPPGEAHWISGKLISLPPN